MAPVAECNLAIFLESAVEDTGKQLSLSNFFGCLAAALSYLHTSKIRHRDIKPENVLVKGDRVFLTDFGISLDWENLTGSTTTKDTAKSLIYCAPEVARYEKRNSSSDVWSLGCIFLEMWTVIQGVSVSDMRDWFRSKSESQRFYENLPFLSDWIQVDLPLSRPKQLLSPYIVPPWIDCMLQGDPEKRHTAVALYEMIINYRQPHLHSANPFCGECCVNHEDTSQDSDGSDSDPLATTQPTSY